MQMMLQPCKSLTDTVQQDKQMIIVASGDGRIECCILNKTLTVVRPDEDVKIREILKV